MSPEALFVLLGAIASVAAVVMAYAAYRYAARKDKAEIKDQSNVVAIQAIIEKELAPVKAALNQGDSRMAVMETKVDLMWENLRKDMARIIHSPDPRRAHVDALMDKIINDEPFTHAEEAEMRKILKSMMMYEPGHSEDLGFPVNPGEQVVAAFLLRSLDYVPIKEAILCGGFCPAGLAAGKSTRMTWTCLARTRTCFAPSTRG